MNLSHVCSWSSTLLMSLPGCQEAPQRICGHCHVHKCMQAHSNKALFPDTLAVRHRPACLCDLTHTWKPTTWCMHANSRFIPPASCFEPTTGLCHSSLVDAMVQCSWARHPRSCAHVTCQVTWHPHGHHKPRTWQHTTATHCATRRAIPRDPITAQAVAAATLWTRQPIQGAAPLAIAAAIAATTAATAARSTQSQQRQGTPLRTHHTDTVHLW